MNKILFIAFALILIHTEINALPFLQKGSQENNGEDRKRSSTTPAPIITDPVNFNASNKNLKSLKSVFNGYDVTKIATLDLSFNQIKNLGPNSFVNFTSLTTLYLNNNLINNIDYNWFINLPSLSSLNLNNNRLTYLRTGIFYGLSGLVTLDLSFNQIQIASVDNLPFVGLIGLNNLILNNNNLYATYPFTFVSLFNLKTLNLRNSNLISVNSLTFSNAWSPFNGNCVSNTNVFLSGNPTSVASVPSGTCFTVSN